MVTPEGRRPRSAGREAGEGWVSRTDRRGHVPLLQGGPPIKRALRDKVSQVPIDPEANPSRHLSESGPESGGPQVLEERPGG